MSNWTPQYFWRYNKFQTYYALFFSTKKKRANRKSIGLKLF